MKIGLIDVDGHNFPNLALMRISAWHKSQGDTVEWWASEFEYYDIVYMSKVFSDVYSQEGHTPMNCGKGKSLNYFPYFPPFHTFHVFHIFHTFHAFHVFYKYM